MRKPKYKYVWTKITTTHFKDIELKVVEVWDFKTIRTKEYVGNFIAPAEIENDKVIQWLLENDSFFKGE